MSMDLHNQNPEGMSMGQLAGAKDQLNGAISDWTRQINAGQAPNFSGGNEYGGIGLDAGASKFASPASKTGFPDTGHTVTSMNYHEDHKAPVDPLFGQKYTRKQFKELMRREAYELSFIAKKGYMPPQKKSEETFRHADSVFVSTQLTPTVTAMEFARNMKFNKVTPEMLLNLGIIPQAIKNNLDLTHVKLANPDAVQTINTLKAGNEGETGQRMFVNSTSQQQEVIANALNTDRHDAPKALRPPSMRTPDQKRESY